MRLLSLAVIAGLVGFGFAADEPKKADKKGGKTVGVLSKVDGDKLVVTMKGDGGDKEVTFTTNDKTKFLAEEAAPAAKDGEKKPDAPKDGDKKPEEKKPEVKDGEKKPEEKKPEEKKEKKPAPVRKEIKIGDLKTGGRVAITAGEDKVATEVVALPAAPKKGDKKDAK